MKTRHPSSPTLLAATLCASAASAQTYVSRRMDGFPGKDELSGQLGFQASLGGATPGGFKMFFDYSHRLVEPRVAELQVQPDVRRR